MTNALTMAMAMAMVMLMGRNPSPEPSLCNCQEIDYDHIDTSNDGKLDRKRSQFLLLRTTVLKLKFLSIGQKDSRAQGVLKE